MSPYIDLKLHTTFYFIMPRKETYSGPLSAQAQQDLVSEGIENFELPKSVVMKIAKSAVRRIVRLSLNVSRNAYCSGQLPDHIKLQKETVLSLVKGSTVFINYLGETYVFTGVYSNLIIG